ncbi:MAG: glycoside hydrolase family 65 protein, partial [Bacteroidaceae bacterium]
MKHYIFCLALAVIAAFVTKRTNAQDKSWIIPAIESQTYTGAPVANGCIGIMPWKELLEIKHVMLNSVFERNSPRGVSKAQMGINPFILHLSINGHVMNKNSITDWKQSIDMKHALHQTSFCVKNQAEISYSIAALGNLPYSGLIEIKIKALKDISFNCKNEMEFPTEFVDRYIGHKSLNDLEFHQQLIVASAYTAYKSHQIAASSAFIYSSKTLFLQCKDQSQVLSGTIKSGETIHFYVVGTICSSRDFSDPIGEVERQVAYISITGLENILQGHYDYWANLWTSDIVIEGDLQAQRDVRFALFNLYGSIRKDSRLSSSPMGLSSQAYNGHVFWDSELWMYPPLLYMHPEIAKSMIDYRFDRLKGAIQKARSRGLDGALFPWESDDSGEESTPTWCLTGVLELHISADIAIATF